jgi:hypothetical protein
LVVGEHSSRSIHRQRQIADFIVDFRQRGLGALSNNLEKKNSVTDDLD